MRNRPGSTRRTNWYRKVIPTIHNRLIGTGLVVMQTINKIFHPNPSSREGILMVLHSVKLVKTNKTQMIIMQRLMKVVAQIHQSNNHSEIPLILKKMKMVQNLRDSHLPKMKGKKRMAAMPRDHNRLRKDKS